MGRVSFLLLFLARALENTRSKGKVKCNPFRNRPTGKKRRRVLFFFVVFFLLNLETFRLGIRMAFFFLFDEPPEGGKRARLRGWGGAGGAGSVDGECDSCLGGGGKLG